MTRTHRARTAALPSALALLLAMSGCSAADVPEPVATTNAPLEFADEAEARAAAEAAFGRYHDVQQRAWQSGGVDVADFESVAVDDALDGAIIDANGFKDAGLHTVGETSFEVREIQQYWHDDETLFVQFTICEDLSGLDGLNADGESMVSPDRQPFVPYTATAMGSDPDLMKISEYESWRGSNYCL
ncbi:hypothetical protein [Agromyces seonyuensis]|uniref:Lipoprotein n=1 Tax=Agromyces seonyuensis TaxID=2662446 RepID=A0A6I4P2Z4_9MICO|nr:hypothetical protein [Agromyces seonyuensis]MWB97667.1 hypothetical protein [Agromyces seonyuensis]